MIRKNKIKTVMAFTVIIVLFFIVTILSIIDFPYNYYAKDNGVIHLYGETHGIKEYYEAEFDEWSDYYNKGDRALFVELPYYEAEFLNVWMSEDNDDILLELYSDWEGTQVHTEYYLDFCRKIKEQCPKTVFYGTDVGHQYKTAGSRYLSYLEDKGMKDSEQYKLAEQYIDQGIQFYENSDIDYREQMMVDNFIDAYKRACENIGANDAIEIMGIYGSYHIDPTYSDIMAGMLKEHYGDVIDGIYVINLFANNVKPYQWGFSYVGIIFLLMLYIPNIIWSKNMPKNYSEYVKKEKKVLVILERAGEVLVTCIVICFKDFNLHITKTSDGIIIPARTYYLILVLLIMVLYEMYWIRYFKSEKMMKDFYSSILGIPLAGATLPVIAAFILGVYGMNLAMIIAVLVLGIGHIGIHYQHYKGLDH